jgi:acetylornithine deacetylase
MSATITTLTDLIAFDTVSRNSNLECIDWARALVEAQGATTRMDWNADRTKANMLATFGEGPGGTVWSGHVDVVPVDGQAWTADPFTATIRDGRLHGRGACDMKGFVAAVLAHAPLFGEAKTREPIHIALTYDEEQGCLGIPHLIRAMELWGVHPTGCIVGEPTSMRLVSAHKGGRVYRTHVTGRPAHSSLTPTAVNAIEYAARIIARIAEIAARFRDHGARDDGYDVPHTTISTNMFEGGNAPNIVPERAEFLFDYRYIPADAPEPIIAELQALAAALQTEMQAIAPETGIAFTLVNAIPALLSAEGSAIFASAHALATDPVIEKVAYGTEAGFFSNYGIPSVVIGPGSIQQAHKPDEYVSLDQLALCDRFIEGLVATL